MPIAVHLDRPPHSAQLLAWGRADDGWWGCIAWRQRLVDDRELPIAAWVPAGALRQPGWAGSEAIPRLTLPPERRDWPAPPHWPSWYTGPWVDGSLPLPPGVAIATGPAWRNRT